MDAHKRKMRHASQDCNWRTPPEMYGALEKAAGGFDIDLAASGENCLVVKRDITHDLNGFDDLAYYLGPDHPNTAMRDSLQVPWHTMGTRGFINPPYSLSLYSKGLEAGTPRPELQWLLIENWARKAYQESLQGFTTWGVLPYAPQTEWFREYVMGHTVKLSKANKDPRIGWAGHAALDFWRIPHRVSFLQPDGTPAANANVNTCVIIWGPNPGFIGPWSPSGRYWSYRGGER